MRQLPTVFDYWSHALHVQMRLFAAQAAIGLRIVRLSTGWPVKGVCDDNIVSEKVHGLAQAITDASKLCMGAKPVETPEFKAHSEEPKGKAATRGVRKLKTARG